MKQFEVESLILEQSMKIKDGPHEFLPFFLISVAVTRMVPCKVLAFPIPLVEYLWSQFRNQKKVPCSVY